MLCLLLQILSSHRLLETGLNSLVKPPLSLDPCEYQGETSTHPLTGYHNVPLNILHALELLSTGQDCACLIHSCVSLLCLAERRQINTDLLFAEKYPKNPSGNSPAAQWLGLNPFIAKSMSSLPGQGSKIL